jgi:hypothetical protein
VEGNHLRFLVELKCGQQSWHSQQECFRHLKMCIRFYQLGKKCSRKGAI